MAIPLSTICDQLSYLGFRRLLVLSGETPWIDQQLVCIKQQIQGDWITISSRITGAIIESKTHLLLGREFFHAIFDATEGFHSEALARLAGTLKAGSLLVLCTPPQKSWPITPDKDSLRWNEQHGMIPTPNFVHHLQKSFQSDSNILMWEQGNLPEWTLLPEQQAWQPPLGLATPAQQQALNQLLSAKQGVWGIIAQRGRGKSTLAGMLLQQWEGECWCCAPAKVSTVMIEQQAGKPLDFRSPDELLRLCASGAAITADWLIIDEAAAIPTYLLRQIIAYFPRVLMTTTVDGYEGTGRGFLSKFCHQLADFTKIELSEPIRWAKNDPLENWLDQALLLKDFENHDNQQTQWQITPVTQQQLANDAKVLQAFYGLLTSAHYRTSPLDLRRLLDAKGQSFMAAKSCGQFIGALWMVEEGGLETDLCWQIWAGLRRPRGNLVAQSLAAHHYFPCAALMKSQRVMRIAVSEKSRRQKIGKQLIEAQKASAKLANLDYLSVSFGLTPELLNFWLKMGFQLVRIGEHLEASSGCYTAMALMPLSAKAESLCERAKLLLARDLFWRNDINIFNLKTNNLQDLSAEDWFELIGFGLYSRTLAASGAAIQRLLMQEENGLMLLRLHFQQQVSIEDLCQKMGLTGQKQWLKCARAEIREIVECDFPELVEQIAQKITISYP